MTEVSVICRLPTMVVQVHNGASRWPRALNVVFSRPIVSTTLLSPPAALGVTGLE
jgi:hypothetical protein